MLTGDDKLEINILGEYSCPPHRVTARTVILVFDPVLFLIYCSRIKANNLLIIVQDDIMVALVQIIATFHAYESDWLPSFINKIECYHLIELNARWYDYFPNFSIVKLNFFQLREFAARLVVIWSIVTWFEHEEEVQSILVTKLDFRKWVLMCLDSRPLRVTTSIWALTQHSCLPELWLNFR